MNIDIPTLLLVNGAVMVIAALSFIVNTVLRRNNDVGRMWTTAFVAGILTTLSYAALSVSAEAWWTTAIGNGAYTLTVAALWCGCRLANERASRFWVALVTAAGVAIAALAPGPDGGEWAGVHALFFAVTAFAIAAAVETVRGRLRLSLNARILTVVFALLALYYVLRTIVLLIDGSDGVFFLTYFGTVTSTFVIIFFVILGAISTSVIAAEQQNKAWAGGAVVDAAGGQRIPGVLDSDSFAQHAADWLARARRDRDDLVLLVFDVANMVDMNTAFGREYGDQAVQSVGRIACNSAPSSAIVAHLSGVRFAILTTAPIVGDAAVVAEYLQTALVEIPVDPVEGIRAIATCGISTTEADGYDFADLQRAALAALACARVEGAGTISLAGTVPG